MYLSETSGEVSEIYLYLYHINKIQYGKKWIHISTSIIYFLVENYDEKFGIKNKNRKVRMIIGMTMISAIVKNEIKIRLYFNVSYTQNKLIKKI